MCVTFTVHADIYVMLSYIYLLHRSKSVFETTLVLNIFLQIIILPICCRCVWSVTLLMF